VSSEHPEAGVVPARLADELWLLAHHDVTGREHWHRRIAGPALAGGLLAELLLRGDVTVHDGVLGVLDRPLPSERLQRSLFDRLRTEPGRRQVRAWLDVLSDDARDGVVTRVLHAGLAQQVTRRRLGRNAVIVVPTDTNHVYWLVVRLTSALSSGASMRPGDVLLAGLAFAVGLDRVVVRSHRGAVLRRLRGLVDALPRPAQEVLAETEAAVARAAVVP